MEDRKGAGASHSKPADSSLLRVLCALCVFVVFPCRISHFRAFALSRSEYRIHPQSAPPRHLRMPEPLHAALAARACLPAGPALLPTWPPPPAWTFRHEVGGASPLTTCRRGAGRWPCSIMTATAAGPFPGERDGSGRAGLVINSRSTPSIITMAEGTSRMSPSGPASAARPTDWAARWGTTTAMAVRTST